MHLSPVTNEISNKYMRPTKRYEVGYQLEYQEENMRSANNLSINQADTWVDTRPNILFFVGLTFIISLHKFWKEIHSKRR